MTKYVFCRSKQMYVTTKVWLLWQNLCHDKTVMTKLCLSWQFFTTKLLSWQAYFCRNKRCVLLRQTRLFVATKMILVAAPASDNFQANSCLWFTSPLRLKNDFTSSFTVDGHRVALLFTLPSTEVGLQWKNLVYRWRRRGLISSELWTLR